MGAWGPGIFDNDTSLDWLGDLMKTTGLSFITAALAAVAEAPRRAYITEEQSSGALAAAEFVAAARGYPCPYLSASHPKHHQRGVAWLAREQLVIGSRTRELADRAAARVARKSELKGLWEDSPKREAWLAAIEDLRGRLQPANEDQEAEQPRLPI